MTAERNVEHALQRWLVDGVNEMPDRVYLSILDRVERQPQQRAWRVSWRDSHVNSYLKPLLAVAAIVVVAVAGFAILRPSGAGVGGAPATETPTLSPPPSTSPAVIECEDDLPGCEGPLVAGTHRSHQFQPSFSYETTSPVRGDWLNVVDISDIFKIDQGNPNNPYVLMWSDAQIVDQNDPCSTNPDPSLGRRAADWIEFLTNHEGLDASDPVDVDFGTITGQQVEISVIPSYQDTCSDQDSFYVGLLTQPVEGRPSKYGLPVSQRMLITVVDVGDRTVVMLNYGPGDADAFRASTDVIRELIASFRFE
jgi:hypothetical protein